MKPLHIVQTDIPDCVQQYNYWPGLIFGGVFVAVVLIVAVGILIGMWIDKR